jgi:hypothetical protein
MKTFDNNRFFTSSEPLPTSINFDSKLSKLHQFLSSIKWSALKHLLSIKMIMKKQLMFCKTRLISSFTVRSKVENGRSVVEMLLALYKIVSLSAPRMIASSNKMA